jgi:hypothetical protein
MPKPQSRTVVKTENVLNEELGKLAAQVLKEWFKDRDSNIPNIVLGSMLVVEKYSASISLLGSKDKFQAAQALIPIIVDLLVLWGKLSKDDGEELKKKLALSVDLVKGLIEVYIEVSKHPAYIQFEQAVKEKTQGCLSACRGKR